MFESIATRFPKQRSVLMRKINIMTAVLITVVIVLSLSVHALAEDNAEYAVMYSDLDSETWYYSSVDSALRYGFMKGTHRGEGNDNLFSPDESLTREQFVTVLCRVASKMPNYGTVQLKYFKDIYEYNSAFSDVDKFAWYGGSIMWAESYGITNGVSDSEFGINKTITREEMATLIVRFIDMYSLISFPESENDLTPFKDISDCSDWAKDSVEQMKKYMIITGDENGYFNPKDTATRSEAAAVFVRLFEKAELELSTIFDPTNVKSIVFYDIDEVTQNPKSFTVDDPSELKETLAYFANGEINDSGISARLVGNKKGFTIYDKGGIAVCSFELTDSSIYISGFRFYNFADGYFKTFCDRLV